MILNDIDIQPRQGLRSLEKHPEHLSVNPSGSTLGIALDIESIYLKPRDLGMPRKPRLDPRLRQHAYQYPHMSEPCPPRRP